MNNIILKAMCDYFGNDDFVEDMYEEFTLCANKIAKELAKKYEFNVK